jgi:hypothetical protein
VCRIEHEPTEPASGESAAAREARLAKNEILFRSVNDAIEERAAESGLTAYEFICECSSASCAERVELTRLQYEHVRADGTRFFVVPGHEKREVEVVVETRPTYLVVEKDGLAGFVADEADPRDDS